MSDTHKDVKEFLQAVFPDHAEHARFAKGFPPGKGFRDVAKFDIKRDCFMSIAAYPPDQPTNRTKDHATEVRVLVVDDVTVTTEAAVVFALGRFTAKVRTSPGNYQLWYRLSKPVPKDQWEAFYSETMVGVPHDPSSEDAVHIFRVPMGTNNKPDRGGCQIELIELNPDEELNVGNLARFPTRPEPSVSAPGSGTLGLAALRELMELIPNDLERDGWIEVGHGLKASCKDDDEGFEVFDHWSLQHPSYDAGKTRTAWDSFGASGLKTQGGMLKARAESLAPEAFRKWEAQAVFDDGEVPRGPVGPKPKGAPHVLASGEFVAGFIPPDYLVKKLITKAFLYSLTGQTGAGKTSITLRLAATAALGRSFGGLRCEPCRVLYLAAENPVDIQMRWIALAAEMDFDVNTIGVFFVKGGFRISATMKELRGEAARVGGDFGLVVVDTGPVFFEGEDENDRTAQRKHARMMRELIEVIPGKPAVIVNVHPVKNAAADNLQPSGGGSFLNEVDGNLTAAKNADQTIELHWQGKWRGVEFVPLHFLLRTVTHPRLVDSDGETMPTVVCDHLSMGDKEGMEKKADTDQDEMLAEMVRHPRVSVSELAVHMGWYYGTGEPDKSKVQRYVKKLRVKREHQLWVVAGMPKSKMNGSGGRIVSADTIRPDTIDTKTY